MRLSKKNIAVTIYGLVCPITNQVKYVGQTRYPLQKRLVAHIATRHTESKRRGKWICSIMELGLTPNIKELEQTTHYESTKRENFWIRKLISEGADLLNCQRKNKKIPKIKNSIFSERIPRNQFIKN